MPNPIRPIDDLLLTKQRRQVGALVRLRLDHFGFGDRRPAGLARDDLELAFCLEHLLRLREREHATRDGVERRQMDHARIEVAIALGRRTSGRMQQHAREEALYRSHLLLEQDAQRRTELIDGDTQVREHGRPRSVALDVSPV